MLIIQLCVHEQGDVWVNEHCDPFSGFAQILDILINLPCVPDQVDIWDHERSDPVRGFAWGSDSVTAVRFNPAEADLLASAGSDRSIALYDLRSSTPIRKIIMQAGHPHPLSGMSSSYVFFLPFHAPAFTSSSTHIRKNVMHEGAPQPLYSVVLPFQVSTHLRSFMHIRNPSCRQAPPLLFPLLCHVPTHPSPSPCIFY
jgi:hypothetical protein